MRISLATVLSLALLASTAQAQNAPPPGQQTLGLGGLTPAAAAGIAGGVLLVALILGSDSSSSTTTTTK